MHVVNSVLKLAFHDSDLFIQLILLGVVESLFIHVYSDLVMNLILKHVLNLGSFNLELNHPFDVS